MRHKHEDTFNPGTGEWRQTWTVNKDDGSHDVVETVQQDIAPVLDANQEARASTSRLGPSEDMPRIASIPVIVAQKWRDESGFDIYKARGQELLAWLRKPENKVFLTHEKYRP